MDRGSLIKLRGRDDTLSLSQGRSVLVTGRDGFIRSNTDQGLFVYETRILSKYRYLLNREEFRPITLSNVEQHNWLGYYLQLPPEMKHGISGGSGRVPKKSQHSIELVVHRTVGEGLRENLQLVNYNQIKTRFRLVLEIDADFADVDEVPAARKQRGALTRMWHRLDDGIWERSFRYRARHRFHHQGDSGDAQLHRGMSVQVREADSEPQLQGGTISFSISLEPHQAWRARLDFVPLVEDIDASPGDEPLSALPVACSGFEEKRRQFFDTSTKADIPGTSGLGPIVMGTLSRAKRDLAALRFYDLDQNGGWVPAAGIPLYSALFGRDVLNAGWQSPLLSAQILRGSVSELSKWQADVIDNWRDALPNGMLHEAHTGPLSLLNYVPRSRYYGTLTTPTFYPIALAELWRWTGEAGVLGSMIDTALRGIKWLDDYSLSERHGFYQYQTRSEQGVKNQGWKDSADAIVYGDGSQVPDPIAPCEGQGYTYAAREQLSQLLSMLGREDEAQRIRAKNPAFKERFNEAFWMEREGLFALGLDSNGRQIASVASNAGHTLGTGIAFPDKAASTINRLFEQDMFSGWGVRTLSSLHPAYNPYSYHRGSVWPVEQGAFAIGCRRYKHNDHLLKLSKAHFELARLFEHFRLPEVLSGHPRDELHPFPSLYPDTNSPQAWSASATYAILYSILGLLPYAALNVLFVDPQLPCWLPEMSVSNLHVGDSVISLRFVRQADGTTDYNVLDLQGKIEIRKYNDPWSLVGLPARELRERTVA